ncbi:diguanylate cyclase, partial [Candidatus Bipolaricaulota bacterium]|nr:diguanylate cyclase [Candidatus Bipolaricaulota bacterium]
AGIWDWNVQTGEVVFDERWAEIAGYTLEELRPVTIETWEELAHPEDLKRSEELLEKHFNGETEVYECEARMKHKSGDWVWVLDRGRVVEWDEEGKPVRMVGTHQDITDRKRAEQALDEERNKLKELHDAVDRFQQCETEDDLCNVAVQVTQRVLDFDLCTFYCVKVDKLVPVAATANTELDELPPHNLDEGLAGESFQKKRSILGDDLRKEERAATDRSELRGYMSVPIGDVGVFQVASNEVGAFGKYDLGLAEILAGHLHEEVKRIRLEEELRQQAIRDPLTELYNRRYFNETLKKEVQKAERYDNPLAFLMLDVNRFKEINDRYSHRTGDEVLREVADLLEKNVRDADTVVRYGGDEFLVMMPETNGGSKNTVKRLQNKLSQWNQESDLLDFPLTLAMGVSHWNPDQDRDVEEALNEADKKMYEDKRKNG